MRNTRTIPLLTAVAAAALVLAGCANTPVGTTQDIPAVTMGADSVSITDAWVKSAESGMSAGFGILENAGEADVTIVSASTAASAEMELHETVDNGSGTMIMQEKDGGFRIPAGGTLALEPGGNHIMLMDLVAPLVAGDEVTFVLTFSDDSTFEFTAAVKDYSGANEEYVGDDMDVDH